MIRNPFKHGLKSGLCSGVTGLAIAGLLAGCTTYYDTKRDIHKNVAQNQAAKDQEAKNRAAMQSDARPIILDESTFLGDDPLPDADAHYLPVGHRHLKLHVLASLPAKDALKMICDGLGMGFEVKGLDLLAAAKAGAQAADSPVNGEKDAKTGGRQQVSGATQFQARDALLLRAITIGNYDGDGAQKLDEISRDLDIAWEVKHSGSGDIISFSTVVERTFEFGSDQGTITINNTVKASTDLNSDGGSASSGSNTDGLTVTRHVELHPWEDLNKMLTMLMPAGSGGAFAAIQSSGRVIISGPPSLITRVEPQVEAMRHEQHLQVAMTVTLVALKTDDEDDYGFSIGAALSDASQTFNVALSTPQTAVISTAAELTGKVTNLPGTGGLFNGTQTILQAVNSMGHTGQKRGVEEWAHNNETVTVQRVSQQAYVQSIGAANSGSTTAGTTAFPTVTPATVTYGFNFHITPHVVDSRHLSLEFGYDLSTLDALVKYPVLSGYNIQQPTRTLSSQPSQTIEMHSGETLVTSSLEIDDSVLNKLGMGFGTFIPGELSGEKQTSHLVIVVSASIIDRDAEGPHEAPVGWNEDKPAHPVTDKAKTGTN